MNREKEIYNHIIQSLRNIDSDIPVNIALTTRFNEDLGFDSLDMVHFIMEIEEIFSISVPIWNLDYLLTIEDVFNNLKGE